MPSNYCYTKIIYKIIWDFHQDFEEKPLLEETLQIWSPDKRTAFHEVPQLCSVSVLYQFRKKKHKNSDFKIQILKISHD